MIFQTENLIRSPTNSKIKYLGTYLSQNLSDDTDIDLRMNHDHYKKCQRPRPIDSLTSKDQARTQMQMYSTPEFTYDGSLINKDAFQIANCRH